MVKFPFTSNSPKYAMSIAALPGGMLGAHNSLRPLSTVLNNDNNDNNNDKTDQEREDCIYTVDIVSH